MLSGIVVSSSGWLVSGYRLNEVEWGLGMPNVLTGGILDTLDLWGGMLVGLVYAALTRSHPELNPLSIALAQILPTDIQAVGAVPLVTPDIGRAICVLLFGSLLSARVIAQLAVGYGKTNKVRAKKTRKSTMKMSLVKDEEGEIRLEELVKTPTKSDRKGATPRKSPRPKKAQKPSSG